MSRLGTRARRAGEAKALRVVLGLSLMVLVAGAAWKTGAATVPLGRPTPSGLPVPRYVSLKFGEVNARAGPGDDYKLLWVYRARGLPLQVIAETADWRRVCDPEGAMAWVHQRTVETRRTVMRIKAEPLAIHRRPDGAAPVVAQLSGRSLAALDNCKDGWCRIEAGRAKGWMPMTELWGADERLQCRAKATAQR